VGVPGRRPTAGVAGPSLGHAARPASHDTGAGSDVTAVGARAGSGPPRLAGRDRRRPGGDDATGDTRAAGADGGIPAAVRRTAAATHFGAAARDFAGAAGAVGTPAPRTRATARPGM